MSTSFKAFDQVQVERTPGNLFNMTFSHKTTMNMAPLYPLMVQDTLPGDFFSITPELLIRYAPMLFPVYQQMRATIDLFYVPNRVNQTDFKEFIAGNKDSEGNNFPIQILDLQDTDLIVSEGSIWDYFGFPVTTIDKTEPILAGPLISYFRIYNEYYQDQNNDPTYTTFRDKLKTLTFINAPLTFGDIFPVGFQGWTSFADVKPIAKSWQSDYFTANLPFAQKGPAVGIPLELVSLIAETKVNKVSIIGSGAPSAGDITSSTVGPDTFTTVGTDLVEISGQTIIDGNDAQLSGTINDLRYSEALQKFYEMNARSGTRYNEFIKAAFDVNIGDARINRPEFIGRISNNVMISEVLQQSSTTDDSALGQYAGYGNALVGGNTLKFYCPEHGWIIAMVSVTPTTAYMQGLPRKFGKVNQLDYPFKQFMHTGEQATLKKELYYDKSDNKNNEELGYLPYASEYKINNDMVSGAMRSSLLPFTLARKFAARPSLNPEFIYVQTAPQKRIFTVEDVAVDSLFVNLIWNIKSRRPISFYSTPEM